MIALLLFGGFALFLILGVPVAFGIVLASLGAILYQGYPMALFGQRLFTSVDSFPLMAIPLFMLAVLALVAYVPGFTSWALSN